MTKQDYLNELKNRLSVISGEDLDEQLSFYSEMIDDRIEDGLSEDEAVAQIGTPEEAVSQILSDYPLAKIVKEKIRPKRKLRLWETILIIVGSPVWLSLLIAFIAVIFSVYIALWAVIISLWAVNLFIVLLSLFEIASSVILFLEGSTVQGFASLGIGVFAAGLSIVLFFGCRTATLGIIKLTKKAVTGIKAKLSRKGEKDEKIS